MATARLSLMSLEPQDFTNLQTSRPGRRRWYYPAKMWYTHTHVWFWARRAWAKHTTAPEFFPWMQVHTSLSNPVELPARERWNHWVPSHRLGSLILDDRPWHLWDCGGSRRISRRDSHGESTIHAVSIQFWTYESIGSGTLACGIPTHISHIIVLGT